MKQVKFVDSDENQLAIYEVVTDKKKVRLMIKSGKDQTAAFDLDKNDCTELLYELLRLKTTL